MTTNIEKCSRYITMNILDRIKIRKMKKEIRSGKNLPPILVSKDGTVIDGSHRVIAYKELGMPIRAIIIDADIIEVNPDSLKSSHSYIQYNNK